MRLLLNIDVPDLAAAEAFYVAAFGLEPARRFGDGAVELLGAQMPLYLLTLFSKGDKVNLTKAERNELAGLVDVLVSIWKGRKS